MIRFFTTSAKAKSYTERKSDLCCGYKVRLTAWIAQNVGKESNICVVVVVPIDDSGF